MEKEIKMHKFGQFIYVKDRKCRVCEAPNNVFPCVLCDYKKIETKMYCSHPNGVNHCLMTVPIGGYLKKL